MVNGQWSMVNDIDTDLLLWLNGAHNAFFDSFMILFTDKWMWVLMYLALAYVIFKNMKPKQAVACIVAIFFMIALADQLSSTIIRQLVCRLRPANVDNPISDLVHIVDGYRGGRYGFPSSHAANSFGLAFFLFYLFRSQPLTLFVMGWAILNCYTRIYLGVHYPGDILCGALVGLFSATLVWFIYKKLTHQTPIKEAKHGWVPMVACLLIVAGISLYACYTINT
ncbi:MAG: phosphatase PAP2 family protein [Bacteroidaceae bacterium]|nr:phosphatase PAP2 family protein [Bacteroidaceae bacterium]